MNNNSYLVAVIYANRDLKVEPYADNLLSVLLDITSWIGPETIYQGDVYLGNKIPEYKTRNRQFKLPKNISKLKEELKEGSLWNLVVYDEDSLEVESTVLYAKMQPDTVLETPAEIFLEIPLSRFNKDDSILFLWKKLFEAVDEYGWGFIDITSNRADYLSKLSGILYDHFPEKWQKEMELWENNASKCHEGILDVYWKNLWSPQHVNKLGGMDKLSTVLKNEFKYQFLAHGGIQVSIPVDAEGIGTEEFKVKRNKLRQIVSNIIIENY